MRINFSAKTKKLIVDRAGHQCSFPTCSRRTISADDSSDKTSSSGVAAHIYPASLNGPRKQNGLTKAELESPNNGIWLCADHGRIVDNNDGNAFPPEVLLSYKSLQEARVKREHQGLYAPIGWIHGITFRQSFRFSKNEPIYFSKLNLFYGPNAIGKTALADRIHGYFDRSYLMKWSEYLYGDLEYQLTYFDPSLVKLGVKMTEGGFPSYLVKGIPASIPPPLMNVIRLSDKSWEKGHDDLDWLCSKLSLPPEAIYQLTLDIGNSEISHITNLRWRQADGKNRLHLDCPGTVPGLFVGQLSGGEREHVLIEFACASARSSGDHFPTLLILDGCPSVVSGDFFQKYTNHLQGPENHFQTIVCIPSQNFNLDSISWEGWEVMRFSKSDKGISIDQTLKISA